MNLSKHVLNVRTTFFPVFDGKFEFVDNTMATPGSGKEYVYTSAGDLKWDSNKGITKIEYDQLGHPMLIQFHNGNRTEYVYAADGRKLRTRHLTAVDGLSVSLGHTLELTDQTLLQCDSVDYMGPFEVKCGIHQFNIYNIYLTEMKYRFDGGFILRSPHILPGQMHPLVQYSSSFHYYLRDHLGNIRVAVNDSAQVEQSNHYYALGGPWGDLDTEQGFQPYKYNGKELDRMHGLDLYDYGARLYDPAIGQFTSIDPLCEKYYHLSPYSYCGGNPVNAIDANGDSLIVLNYGKGLSQHSALLIQGHNNEGESLWHYYSHNGTKFFESTKGYIGGRPYHNYGEFTFNTPEEFFLSSFNTNGNIVTTSGYKFSEGYIIPSSIQSDELAMKTFVSNSKRGYNLFSNNCVQVVQRTLESIGIDVKEKRVDYIDSPTPGFIITSFFPLLPSDAFETIVKNNPDGKYIKKKTGM